MTRLHLLALPASLVSPSVAFAPTAGPRNVFSVNSVRRKSRHTARNDSIVCFASNEGGNPLQSLLAGIFKEKQVETAEPEVPMIPDAVIDPSYSVAIGFAVCGLFFLILLQGG